MYLWIKATMEQMRGLQDHRTRRRRQLDLLTLKGISPALGQSENGPYPSGGGAGSQDSPYVPFAHHFLFT